MGDNGRCRIVVAHRLGRACELVDPLRPGRGRLEVEDRAVRSWIEIVLAGVHRVRTQTGAVESTAEVDLSCEPGRRDAEHRFRDRPLPGVREIRLDERVPSEEVHGPGDGPRTREPRAGKSTLRLLDPSQELVRPAWLVRLDDDLRSVVQPQPDHAPDRGLVEQRCFDLCPQGAEDQALERESDPFGVRRAEHCSFHHVGAAIGDRRGDQPRKRGHAPTLRPASCSNCCGSGARGRVELVAPGLLTVRCALSIRDGANKSWWRGRRGTTRSPTGTPAGSVTGTGSSANVSAIFSHRWPMGTACWTWPGGTGGHRARSHAWAQMSPASTSPGNSSRTPARARPRIPSGSVTTWPMSPRP